QQVGIQPGSPIAILGPDPSHQAWARLARVRIIAQIPNAERFWAVGATVQSEVLSAMKQAGASAIVVESSERIPDEIARSRWLPIGSTGYYAYPLQP
ncbi:hypothetical protein H6F43_15280, partial [Leptolyngbya sp. FACHB-36]|uniref:hypothetical protein n=1 Tax=Leptolyngbya sp. FACHB-36 TaxID=2692808 RepID=UPI00168111BA